MISTAHEHILFKFKNLNKNIPDSTNLLYSTSLLDSINLLDFPHLLNLTNLLYKTIFIVSTNLLDLTNSLSVTNLLDLTNWLSGPDRSTCGPVHMWTDPHLCVCLPQGTREPGNHGTRELISIYSFTHELMGNRGNQEPGNQGTVGV